MSAGPTVLPPSPPTTSSRKATTITDRLEHIQLDKGVNSAAASNTTSLGTPDESPASFPGSSGSGSGTKRKRVEFSPWTNIHDAPVYTASTVAHSTVKILPPSRECSSSGSILKVGNQPDATSLTTTAAIQSPMSLADMLESILQQLSQGDKIISLDAYQTLSSTLKAYDEVPDSRTLKEKMSSLTQYIRRDLAAPDKSQTGPADTNLVTQSLKVLVILVWNHNFSVLLTEEFRGFTLDRAIQVIEEHIAPKTVIIHYLHLLATQNFRQGTMNAHNRATRLLEALKQLTTHVKGSGPISERLMVYHRLLEQAKSSMKSKPLSWIEELVEALTSPVKDTRTKAIMVGKKAVSVFPSSSLISHALRETLEKKVDDLRTLGDIACKRLEKMISVEGDGLQVPQILAIVVLLMRGIEGRIDNWDGLKDWLRVIQKCFNCSSPAVKSQASLAWNRFVYVVGPSDATESLMTMLVKPVAVQMESRAAAKQDKNFKATAFSSYCNLLYYAFRPSASHKQYDRAWDEYVVKVLKQSYFERSSANGDGVSRILMGLFWNASSQNKLWRDVRAMDNSLVEPEELPTIDCKWIRSNTASILRLFTLLFKSSCWGAEGPPDQAFVAVAWKHFSKALGDACSKEIITSPETAQAVADVLTFLRSIWTSGPVSLNVSEKTNQDAFVFRFHFICMTVASEIGSIPFVEGNLCWDDQLATFAVGSKAPHAIDGSPLTHFLRMISCPNDSVMPDKTYMDMVKDVLLLSEKARTSLRLRLRLYRKCAESLFVESSPISDHLAAEQIWVAIATLVDATLKKQAFDVATDADTEIHEFFKDVVKVLDIGISYSTISPGLWASLLTDLSVLAKRRKTHSRMFGPWVVEPLTLIFERRLSTSSGASFADFVACALSSMELSNTTTIPRQGRVKVRTKAAADLSPLFEKLLFILNHHLENLYGSDAVGDNIVIPRLVGAAVESLKSCPSECVGQCLKPLEGSLILWLEDSKRLLTSTNPLGELKLVAVNTTDSLCKATC